MSIMSAMHTDIEIYMVFFFLRYYSGVCMSTQSSSSPFSRITLLHRPRHNIFLSTAVDFNELLSGQVVFR